MVQEVFFRLLGYFYLKILIFNIILFLLNNLSYSHDHPLGINTLYRGDTLIKYRDTEEQV